MNPTVVIGSVVRYTLTEADASIINRRRTDSEQIARRLSQNPPQWPAGAQAHIGNQAKAGQVFPMLVTAIESKGGIVAYVNGQVSLDGNDVLWKQGLQIDVDGEGLFAV